MKVKHLILVAFLMPNLSINAQQIDKWEKWKPLIGDWSGEGIGIPGDGTGTFSFTFDSEQNTLVRKSNYSYLGEKMYTIFEDTMIIYLVDGVPSKAVFSNHEGFTRNYSISYSDKTITLISENLSQTPIFRLTYTFINNTSVSLEYEISRDGINFITYTEEIGKKKPAIP